MDEKSASLVSATREIFAVLGAADAVLWGEEADELDTGGAGDVVSKAFDVRLAVLVDTGLIGQQPNAPAPHELHAVTQQHADPGPHSRLRRLAESATAARRRGEGQKHPPHDAARGSSNRARLASLHVGVLPRR